jgi:hypothetical protein
MAGQQTWWSRYRTRLLALGVVLVLPVGTSVACDANHTSSAPDHSAAPASPQKSAAGSSAPPPAPSPSAKPPVPAGLTADFPALQARLHAKIGIVVGPVGAGSKELVQLGDWSVGKAWSTIKVPLVMAAMRKQKSDQVTAQMTAAITESDNAAALSIWAGLGDSKDAAAQVDAVLHETGDPTHVQSEQVRPPYTPFGQTDWSLTDQAQFLSVAACDSRNKSVLNLMSQVESDQQWGLGVLPNTKIKGGWGPSAAPSGNYLVRQMGLVPSPKAKDDLTVVAIAAEPESGSFADGTKDLTEIAQWLQAHIDLLPAAPCKT